MADDIHFTQPSLRDGDRRQPRRPIAVYRQRAIFLDGTIIYGGWMPQCRLCKKTDTQMRWGPYESQSMAISNATYHLNHDHPALGGRDGLVLPVSREFAAAYEAGRLRP